MPGSRMLVAGTHSSSAEQAFSRVQETAHEEENSSRVAPRVQGLFPWWARDDRRSHGSEDVGRGLVGFTPVLHRQQLLRGHHRSRGTLPEEVPGRLLQEQEEEVVLQEITEEEITEEAEAAPTAEEVIEAVEESQETGIELPENIQKVVDFINDTGGTLEDYVSLNKDYSNVDDQNLLKEYYQKTKPHLSIDEIDFLIEDKFSFDEEIDEERDIKRKKLAFKEELAGAKNHLDGLKTKYYEEIKGGSRLTQDQQKAVDFFNRYNKETEEVTKVAEKQKSLFQQKTNQVFSDQFKGFEYNVGEKKYRFNVKNTDEVKTTQSDINNFVKKFLNENNEMSDAKGYHKSLFTAMNADTIANHFYQQGKTDALRESMGKAKNIKMDPRGVHNQPGNNSGIKARVVGESTSSLKMKLKNY